MADPTIPRLLTEEGDVEDIDLTGEQTGHSYPDTHPQLLAIRNGLPDLLVPSRGGSPGQLRPTISRRPSDASSYRSRASSITVSDRGDELYIEAREARGPEPHPPRSDSSVKAANLAKADDEDLWGRVTRLQCQSPQSEDQFFFPRPAIEWFFTPRVIKKILQDGVRVAGGQIRNLESSEIEWYAERIRGTGRSGEKTSFIRILTILVLIEKQADIVCFVDHGLSDADLPLSAVLDDNLVDLRHQGSDSSIACLADCQWSKRIHKEFNNIQWSVLSPYFTLGASNKSKFYPLSKKDILPWTKIFPTRQGGGTGGFSDVFRVEIHSSNHNFEVEKGYLKSFAVKQLKLSVEDGQEEGQGAAIIFEDLEALKADFKAEIEILKRFSGYKHPHLISLLAAYRRGDECCLLFHWANGNLKELWERNDPGPPLAEGLRSLRWMLWQCRGMVDGLCKIHVYPISERRTGEPSDADDAGQIYGRHGDLKPQNILVFPGSPEGDRRQDFTNAMLVISDFGLTKFHSDRTRTYFPWSATAASPTYRPPECDLTNCKISRAFDIWSLGCIMLEFITWYLGGLDLLKVFVARRQRPWVLEHFNSDHFFEVVREISTNLKQIGVRVKLEVHEFVDELHARGDCSPLIHELLDYIMSNMLVVEADDVEKKRDGAKDVLQKLDYLCSKLDDREFAGRPAPRAMPDGNEEPPAIIMPLSVQVKEVFGYGRRTEQLREHTGRVIQGTDTGR